MQIGSYVDININSLVPLDALDVDPEVKQLFIDVFHSDPQLRPGALELLNRPIISSAVKYNCYFDECYDSEDAEDLEASPASKYDGGGQISLHSLGDEVDELPQIPYDNPLQHTRGSSNSEDSGVGRDFGSSVRSGSQISSSSSSNYRQRRSCQDSGLEDMIADECSQPSGECMKGGGGRERERDDTTLMPYILFLPCSVYPSASCGHACTIICESLQ